MLFRSSPSSPSSNTSHTHNKLRSLTDVYSARRQLITIRWALPFCVIFPLISGISLTSWLAFQSGQTAVEELVGKIGKEVAANIEKQVTGYLFQPSLVSAVVSAEVTSGNINVKNTAELSQNLWQLTRSGLLSQNIYYGNQLGEFVYSSYQDGKSRLDLRDQSTYFLRTPYYTDELGNISQGLPESAYNKAEYREYDPRDRDWYKNAIAQKTVVWSGVYKAKSNNQLTLTRSTPILNSDGQIEGVFGIDIYLFELSDFLKKLSVSPHGQAFIIETSGNLIAASNQYEAGITAVDSADPLIQATASGLLKTFGSFKKIERQESFSFKKEGEKQLAYVYRFQEPGIDWLIGVTIPQSDYMETINASACRTLIIGFAITGIASLFALVTTLHIIHPIREITQAAQTIKNNQFNSDDLAGVIARSDEFSELATVFNHMAIVIVSREQDLAEQVRSLKSEIDQQGNRSGDRQKLNALLRRAKEVRK
jgi:hypothetical protein